MVVHWICSCLTILESGIGMNIQYWNEGSQHLYKMVVHWICLCLTIFMLYIDFLEIIHNINVHMQLGDHFLFRPKHADTYPPSLLCGL